MQTRKLKPGQFVEAVCQELVQEGFGLSHIESAHLPYPLKPLTGFIWGVLPQERFVARVTQVKGNHFHGVVLRKQDLPDDWLGKEPSNEQKNLPNAHPHWALFSVHPKRVDSPCSNFTLCGGCKLLHLAYGDGAAYKEKWLLQQLEHRKIVPQKTERLLPQTIYHYRNHVQVHINKHKERGFYAPFSYRVQKFPHSGCLLFDEQAWQKSFPQPLELVRCVRSRLNLSAHNRAKNISTWELNSPEEKKSFFTYQVAYPPNTQTDVTLPVGAFFQVNQSILPQWLEHIEAQITLLCKAQIAANKTITILELFSGSGFITRLLAYRLPLQSIGIDILKSEDMEQIKIVNDKLGESPLQSYRENYICQNLWELEKIPLAQAQKIQQSNFDILLLNPPRGGFAQESLHYLMQRLLANFSSPIIYSSCNGATLARDLENFYTYGYKLQELIFMDFFPFTAHYESLAVLVKRHEK